MVSAALRLIRFRGHIPKGGYDVHRWQTRNGTGGPAGRFTDEFKASAVRLVLDEGKTVGGGRARSRSDGIGAAEVGRAARAPIARKGRTGLTTAEREELARLRKENRDAAEEREILKNESRALMRPDLWARNSVAYARTPGAVAVRFLVTS